MIYDRLLEVNGSAIRQNIDALRERLTEECRLVTMVKANGYGTDALQLARLCVQCGIDLVGVAHVEEGEQLRAAGFEQDILLMHATPEQARQVGELGVEVGVGSAEMLQALADVDAEVPVHLQINTGINRFGCRPLEALGLAEQIASDPRLHFAGIMTHFAAADDTAEDLFTRTQMAQFDGVVSHLEERGICPRWRHVGNSAGIARFDLREYNMARPGLMVLGVHPSPASQKAILLTPALRLASRIVKIHYCKKGESVSYGRTYRVQREEERIAVLPIGYGDGLRWSHSGKGYASVRGQRAPFVGNICMDYMMIDVTNIKDVAVGDEATLFGGPNSMTVEEFATVGETIAHEVVAALGTRIHRRFY